MKKTQTLDHLRNIRKQFVSWLSIIIISMLAVVAFLGIRFTAGSLQENINSFSKESGYRDLQILSTLRFSQDDLKQIQNLDGVEKAEGNYSYAALVKTGRSSRNATFLSLSDSINVPRLISGNLPAKDNECLIEEGVADQLGVKIGDILYTDQTPYLKQNIFTISGICIHPDHVAKLMDNASNNYVLIDRSIFNEEEDGYDHSYSSIEVRFTDTEKRDAFSNAYFDSIGSKQKSIEDLSDTRAKLRYDQVIGKMNDAIDENQAKLDEAKAQLDEARKLLDENQAEIAKNEKKLASSYTQLKNGKAQLDEGKKTLDQVGGQLAGAEQELDKASEQLDDAKRQLTEGYQSFIDIRNAMRTIIEENDPEAAAKINWVKDDSFDVDDRELSMKNFPITEDFRLDCTMEENFDQLRDFLLQFAKDEEQAGYINDATELFKENQGANKAREWEDGHIKYLAGKAEYSEAYGTYKSAYRSFIQGLEEYEVKMAEYEEGMAAYRRGHIALNKAKDEIAAKEEEYAAKLSEYEDGVKAIQQARERISQIPENRWILFNIKGNASYVFSKSLTENFSGISVTFSLLFVVIGALVIYATVGKTIDEQRTQVGTTKALGFFNSEIMCKYMVFGLSASVIGVVSGILLSYYALLRYTVRSQATYFHLGRLRRYFEPVPVAIVAIAALLLTIAAVYLACSRLVKQPARILMQDSAPPAFKGSKNAKASSGSLYSKLILRNMLSDPKRVFVTIVSIAGSCALIFIGLTILHSISSASTLQFDYINRYDFQVDYDSGINEKAEEQIEAILNDCEAKFIKVRIANVAFLNEDELDSCRFLIGDLSELNDYILITDTKTKKPMTLDKEGVYVTIKANETVHYTDKGKITVFDEIMNSYDADVADDFMLYAARIFLMSRDTYEKVYGKEPIDSQYLVKIDETVSESTKEKLLALDGVNGIVPSDRDRGDFNDFVSLARAMVILLTAMAFAMAYFILLNLVNMFINQKTRELTIMRINGFTVKEVKNYVGKELILTTAIGILLGLPLGAFMAYKIILLLENTNCFDRSIYYPGGAFAAAVTALFSFLIAQSALAKVKDLKLTDI